MGNDKRTGSLDSSRWSVDDTKRLEDLFRNHRSAIQRVVTRFLVSPFDSDDVLQDTFLAVWRKMIEGVAKTDVRAYLFRTAVNSARDKNRNRRRIGAITVEIPEELPDATTPPADEALFLRQRLKALEVSLRSLSPLTRGIFVFYHLEGMSVQEIADRINRSTRTVERHLAVALKHCMQSTEE